MTVIFVLLAHELVYSQEIERRKFPKEYIH